MRSLLRRAELDFSDYLELRRAVDAGEATPESRRVLAALERALPVPFARAIPHLVTLADAHDAPPRELTREAVRVAFGMREEFCHHGSTRAGLSGFDLPEGLGLKDWLDLVETERKLAVQSRKLLRELDGKLWRMFTGERRMPSVRAPLVA